MDGVNKAHALGTNSTAHASLGHSDPHTGHYRDFGADLGGNVGQHPPKTTARTTVANRQQLVAWADAEPYGIELASANQMNQARFPAASHVLQRFRFRYAASKPGIDAHGRLAEKETAQINGIILARHGIAADAKVHDPVIVGFLDEMLHHLRRQNHLVGPIERLVYGNHLILRQIDEIVPLEEQAISDSADDGYLRQPGQQKTMREQSLYEFGEPEGLTHGDTRITDTLRTLNALKPSVSSVGGGNCYLTFRVF